MNGTQQTAPANRAYPTIWLATLLFFGAFYTLLAPFPGYLERVGLADWQIGLVLGAFGVASLIGRPLAGLAVDSWGPRPVLLLGALALVLGAVAVPATSAFGLLFALRMSQAAGYVAFTTAGTALVIRLTPPAIRGRRLALFGAAANVAITFIPAAVSIALATAPLTTAFYVAGGLALVAGGLVLPLTAPPAERGATTPERMSTAPLFLPMIAAGLIGAGFAAFFQFVPLLVERRGGWPAGVVYTVYGLGIILARLGTGPLIDRWRIGRSLALAAGLMALGLAWLAVGAAPLGVAAATLLIAIGSGVAHPALLKHHAALLPAAPGRASAAFYLGFDLGIGFGSVLFGIALELGGLAGLYGLAALLTLGAIPLARWLPQAPGDAPPAQVGV